MKTPFVFGRLATGSNFTDRESETAHLVNNFTSLINTIIISPRRWGKSSLVHKAAEEAKKADANLRICHIDLFNVRDEQHFYTLLAERVIKATSSHWDEVKENVLKFMTKIIPKIVMTSDPGVEFSLDLNWERVNNNIDEILDLAERIACDKGLRLMICIDEFQNIAYFSDPQYMQKRLRSHWQKHQNVGYCLYGSKRHMLMEVFADSSQPFYKFGDLMFLGKIPEPYLCDFITERFEETGKSISDEARKEIVELTECHPYYTQQLAQLAWLRTTDHCDTDTVRDAHISLVQQMSLLFDTLTAQLNKQQLAYLHAISDGCENISATASMQRYGISSATSASRAKKALISYDIIDDIGGKPSMQDPIYAYWLRHFYFKN